MTDNRVHDLSPWAAITSLRRLDLSPLASLVLVEELERHDHCILGLTLHWAWR